MSPQREIGAIGIDFGASRIKIAHRDGEKPEEFRCFPTGARSEVAEWARSQTGIPIGLTGAVLQMFSHGIIAAALFAMVGTVIYTRTHTRMLDDFHRLMERMPAIAWVFVVAGLASMGLPGFSGFISELYVLIGVWQSNFLSKWIVVGAGLGILLTFGYTLVKIHEAFFSERDTTEANGEPTKAYSPMTIPEIIGCAILLGASLLIGLFPWLLTSRIVPSLEIIIDRLPN